MEIHSIFIQFASLSNIFLNSRKINSTSTVAISCARQFKTPVCVGKKVTLELRKNLVRNHIRSLHDSAIVSYTTSICMHQN